MDWSLVDWSLDDWSLAVGDEPSAPSSDDYQPRGAVRFPQVRRPEPIVLTPAEPVVPTVDDDEALILFALSR